MKDVTRLLYVAVCAIFFIGFYLLSDIYAREAVGKYAHEISSEDSKLNSNGEDLSEDLPLENAADTERPDTVLSFVGDITFENAQLERYYDETSETFDFTNSFKYITRYLQTSDLVSANLEAVFAGPDKNYENVYDQYGTAGFLYNAPEVAAKNMKTAGISLVQTANEHGGDFGIEGIKKNQKYLEEAGLKHTGTAVSKTEKRYTMVSVNGLSIGFVAYSNNLNQELDEDSSYGVNYLNNYDETKIEQMCSDIRAARSDHADFVVAMVYAGEANGTEADEQQKALFDQLFNAGADIVIGTRPYALQPIEVRNVTEADGSTKKAIGIYSLGTFLGSEVYGSSGVDNDLGAILDIIIHKEGAGKPQITGLRLTPTCITYTDEDVFVLPAGEVKENPKIFSSVADETVMERIHTACDEIIPGLLEETGFTGTYSSGIYQVNF